MHAFDALLEITDKLHSPEGCAWDRAQTFETLKAYVLEEAHEVLEAVDEGDKEKMVEELGDLFYTIIFYAKIAQKKGLFSIWDILEILKLKLIRRHPHVFGEIKTEEMDEIIEHWERIKKEEKKHRESALDGIPKTLPLLARAQKILQRMQRGGYTPSLKTAEDKEKELAQKLYALTIESSQNKIDLESAFRKLLNEEEAKFRQWEKT